jgi:F-type H+-transporting ATPase subunit a
MFLKNTFFNSSLLQLSTPLEQFAILDSFEVIDLIQTKLAFFEGNSYLLLPFNYHTSIFLSNYDFSFLQQIISITLIICVFLDYLLVSNSLIISSFNNVILFCHDLTLKQLGKININFVFILLTIAFFITSSNVFGMITYTLTPTSQLSLTFFIAAWFIHYINISSIILHNAKFFSLFFPTGSPLALSLLIVPIETISYFFRKISLSVRLFANMMAGHTLLKVIIGFIYSYLLTFEIFVIFISLSSLLLINPLLIALTSLELGVAFIQGYVFLSLSSMYATDAKDLH